MMISDWDKCLDSIAGMCCIHEVQKNFTNWLIFNASNDRQMFILF